MIKSDLQIRIPGWLQKQMAGNRKPFETVGSRMQFAITLSRLNIEHGSGGPFGAAVFDMDSGELISTGVNLVTANHCSMAHAEMVAISMAQQNFSTYDLGAPGMPRLELVSSCEPCAMCFGALPWSGIRHLVCGANADDACAIGFDEGPRHPNWVEELLGRNITVETGIRRDEARQVLNTYAALDGIIYNGRQQ